MCNVHIDVSIAYGYTYIRCRISGHPSGAASNLNGRWPECVEIHITLTDADTHGLDSGCPDLSAVKFNFDGHALWNMYFGIHCAQNGCSTPGGYLEDAVD
jgi:hypothetical protein